MPCPATGCTFLTQENLPTYEMVLRSLELHARLAHPELAAREPAVHAAPRQTGPKPTQLPRPELQDDVTEQEWNHWLVRWQRYKRSCLGGMEDTQVLDQLWYCCSEKLEKTIYKQGLGNETCEADLLKVMQKMAVKTQNVLLNIVSFLGMGQDTDEPVKHYTARLRGQAAVCNFTLPAGTQNYTDRMVQHQLVRGLCDPLIQEQVLAHAATEGGSAMDLTKTINLIEAKESGKADAGLLHRSHATTTLNRISDYRNGKREAQMGSRTAPTSTPASELCMWCKKSGHGARAEESIRKEKCPAFGKDCGKCGITNHFTSACRKKNTNRRSNSWSGGRRTTTTETSSGVVGSLQGTGPFCQLSRDRSHSRTRLVDHHVYSPDDGLWVKKKPETHPSLEVTTSVCESGYRQMGLTAPRAKGQTARALGLPDTGAQMCVAGMNIAHALGMKRGDLIKVSSGVSAANNGTLTILGGMFLTLTIAGGSTSQLVYVAQEATCLFLSQAACRDLGLIPTDFPLRHGTVAGCTATEDEEDTGLPCSCPRRTTAPPPPELPFPATADNRKELEDFILKYYAPTAFNQCEKQPLPLMDGHPPLRLHVDENAKPFAIHKARPVPMHWQQEVKAGLDRDVALGVLERVPVEEPTDWCAPMTIAAKKNGAPRRTIDFQQLNKACKRQTHPTEAPFHQACAVPANTRRTVLDAWNGFHSVPLCETDESKAQTTFLTLWGRYRYKTAPQGFLAAGDAYTARYDSIISGFKNVKKCIDDSILWGDDLEEIFHHTCRYISHCASAGITFNPSKFVFGAEEVEFLGFQLTRDSVKPTDTYLASIRDFPEPTDLTGARSWFGLINQVNFAYADSELMLPFRHLLKPGTSFDWTPELAQLFKTSKQKIVNAVVKGVKTFDMTRQTCLATDWSRTGMGFALLQRHCACTSATPLCCTGGWELTYAGSRFTTPAESRYHPVEGEALGAAWALHKTRHFTLGCRNLILAVDHKPLLKILGDRELADIENPRILNFKEKTLRWTFQVIHVPGVLHKIADAASRSPVGSQVNELHTMTEDPALPERCSRDHLDTSALEEEVRGGCYARMASLGATGSVCAQGLQVITWASLSRESERDPTLRHLFQMVTNGAPEERAEWPEELRSFYNRPEQLTTIDNVVLTGGRAIIPAALRQQALDILHSGHCGATGMADRAREVMFWPGMTQDTIGRRANCSTCIKIAPSQPAAPPTPLPTPRYPFQSVCSDYFQLAGNHYMVFVCRYSNWLSIYPSRSGKSSELITVLRSYMATFGVMEELATDGDTVYTSKEIEDFLTKYGVHHRVSSSYFPHSNQRAEGAVRAAKRMLRDNMGPGGSLDTDSFLAALLLHRNTPSADLKTSPSEAVFGRKLKDFLPITPGKLAMNPEWHTMLAQREAALARRHQVRGADLTEHTRRLKPLAPGSIVSIQNQRGNHPLRWEHTGTVVETGNFDQYTVKVDGSGRLTKRNRRFLRPIQPYRDELARLPSGLPPQALTPALAPTLAPTPAPAPAPAPTPATAGPSSPRRSRRILRQRVSGN
jgi:hypothetical protein